MNNLLDVVSVNISELKGTVKKPVREITITEQGICGDAHSGMWNRQVSLLGIESLEKFMRTNHKNISCGDFAENITTQGMELYNANPLDRFISEDLVLEITQIGKTCHGKSCAIFNETGNCIMPSEGIFCRVIHPGQLKTGDKLQYLPRTYTVFVLTVSDRASMGIYEDRSGPAIEDITMGFLQKFGNVAVSKKVVPDDPEIINKQISSAVAAKSDIIITTGGTGIGPRDHTIEAAKKIVDKEIPGIMEYIRAKYGAENPAALLSRSVAGVKDQSLIYCLPGSQKAVREYLSEITKTMMHSLYMLHGLDSH